MVKNYFLIFTALLCFEFSFTQANTLCSPQIDYITIQNISDVPTVSNNNDGTVTLTHPEQYITDIFSNYDIYEFYQSFPESTEFYTIVHNSKALINSIFYNVSSSIFEVQEYTFSPVDPNLITLLDNKTFKLISFCRDIPEVGETCEDNQVVVSNDFDLKIAFNYDSNLDIMNVETVNLSPCGNSFSVGMRGGYEDFTGTLDNKLQLWESELGISNESDVNDPCHYPELMFYGLLDISCFEGSNVGNLFVYPGTNTGQIILERETAIFSTDFMVFEEDNLSIEENSFTQMKPYKTVNNPYLQISNSENQSISIEILSLSGQIILKETPFETNSIALSNFAKGLYFIKLKTLNNQQKVFKFLNN